MFFNQADLKTQVIDDNSYRQVLAHSGSLMNVKVFFKQATPAAPIPVHQHVHEQTTYVLKGTFKFEIREATGTQVQEVHEGDSIYFPANVFHGCIPLADDSQLLDSFTPQREDFLQ